MARVEFLNGIIALHGAISKSNRYYFRTGKFGRTYLCRKPQQVPKVAMAAGDRNLARFRIANQMAQEVLKAPALREGYENSFKAQKRYVSLHGYVMAMIYRSLS